MKLLDRRTIEKMSEDERTRYEQEMLKLLPDATDKAELVDIDLLISKIPLRSRPGNTHALAAPPQDTQGQEV